MLPEPEAVQVDQPLVHRGVGPALGARRRVAERAPLVDQPVDARARRGQLAERRPARLGEQDPRTGVAIAVLDQEALHVGRV